MKALHFETNKYPRYHSNCNNIIATSGVHQLRCTNAAFSEGAYSVKLSDLRLGRDRSVKKTNCRLAASADSLKAVNFDRLRHSFYL